MNAVANRVVHGVTGAYIRDMLEAWGREFQLFGESEPNAETLLYKFMLYGGEIPRLEGGRPPEHVNEQAYAIEVIVAKMHQTRPIEASVMRAWYCGRGRQKFERREQAQALAGCKISEREYFAAYLRALAYIEGALSP
jgi:hypothetical protein